MRRTPCGLEQRVLLRWRALGRPPGTIVAVGFSGGADSLALGAVLGRLAETGGLSPVLIHVDHAARPDSAGEQRRAGALAADLGLPFRGLRLAKEPRIAHPGVGFEDAARRERYRVLVGALGEVGAAVLALAHHQQDQAETVLLHLLRGAGVTGAAGMREWTELTVPWWPDVAGEPTTVVHLWRPLLAEPRGVVRDYATNLGLEPIDDPTNADRRLRRNALRAKALPMLERIVPGAAGALARYARLAADDDAALEALAAAAFAKAVGEDGALRRSVLGAEPLAVGRRVVRRWVGAGSGPRGLAADRVEAILGLAARGERGQRVEIGEGFVVRVGGDGLRLGRMPGPNDGAEGEAPT